MAESPDDIVGHKTFDTGEINPETGFPKLRHEPVTRAEADALWAQLEAEKKARAERWPTAQAAVNGMIDCWQRLKELGFKEARYAPRDARPKQVIEPGSSGIHTATRRDGDLEGWWIEDGGDLWPSSPILYLPDDQENAEWERRCQEGRAAMAELRSQLQREDSSGRT